MIDSLIAHVEELGCTCADGAQRTKFHTAKGRRRKDSACTGVALAVEGDLQRRRALKLRERD